MIPMSGGTVDEDDDDDENLNFLTYLKRWSRDFASCGGRSRTHQDIDR